MYKRQHLCSAISLKRSGQQLSIDVAEHRSILNSREEKYVFWFFFKIGLRLCSAISFKRSRQQLSIDVAEHRSISKNKGGTRKLVIIRDTPMFSHIIEKVWATAFY